MKENGDPVNEAKGLWLSKKIERRIDVNATLTDGLQFMSRDIEIVGSVKFPSYARNAEKYKFHIDMVTIPILPNFPPKFVEIPENNKLKFVLG